MNIDDALLVLERAVTIDRERLGYLGPTEEYIEAFRVVASALLDSASSDNVRDALIKIVAMARE